MRRMQLICMAAVIPAMASAQFNGTKASPFDFGNGQSSSTPWAQFKLNPKKRVKLDFHSSSPDAIIQFFEDVSGVTIVKDPSLTGQLALTSARPVPLNDAFQILSTTLQLKGYSLEKQGNLLVIRGQKQNNNGVGGGPFGTGTNPFGGGGDGGGEDRNSLKVYLIKYASATALAKVLNDVYQQTNNGFPGGFQFNRGFGGGGPGGGRFGGGGGGFNGGGGGGFGNIFRGFGQQQPNVRASADDYSNSVIVNAPDRDQTQVALLIGDLDKPSDLPQHSKVYHLVYANATDSASVVQNVLTANVPRGKGGATSNQSQGPAAFFSAIRGQTPGSGQVAVDVRTNSLVVTATDDDILIVDQVIKELDVNKPIESNTFVFQLQNARADGVASVMQAAFGTRSGVSSTSISNLLGNSNIAGTRPTQMQNQNSNATSGGGGGGALGGDINPGGDTTFAYAPANATKNDDGSVSFSPSVDKTTATNAAKADDALRASGQTELAIPLQDPSGTSGTLYTAVQGFGGFGRGGGGGGGGGAGQGFAGNSGNGSTQGQTIPNVGPNGQQINVRDLTNQVTIIPDINTNSLIVVAAPQYADIVKLVLQQLDHTPQQVVIETKIIEAELDKSNSLGIDWSLAHSLGGISGDSSAKGTIGQNLGTQAATQSNGTTAGQLPGFTYQIASKNLSLFLSALAGDTKFQVLSSPTISTMNNVQAQINVSQSVPYVTSSQITTLGTYAYNYSFLSVGVILTILPRITSGGNVQLDVTQTADDLQGYTSFNAPIVNQRQANTTIAVQDGNTVVIGGMIRKQITATVNKVPLLGDIPILGNLFRNTSKSQNRTELMVFLTPHIINSPSDATKIADDQSKKLTPDITGLPDKPGGGPPPAKVKTDGH